MINKDFSFKDFTNKELTDVSVENLNFTTIKGSCFYQEAPEDLPHTMISMFPEEMTGVAFDGCNLNNVHIPNGNTILSTSCNDAIQIQNDLEDWILDVNGDPVEPVNKDVFLKLDLSIDPLDIPSEKLNKRITKV